MEIGIIILFNVSILLMGFSIRQLIRNNQVHDFRRKMLDIADKWTRKNDYKDSALDWFYDKLPSYNSMMLSFKKLTLENWATKDQIKKLNTLDSGDN